MSAASLPKLLTVEEFDRLPDPVGGWYELRHGEAVFVSFPERRHKEIQRRLRTLLEQMAAAAGVPGICDTEFPYRPFAQHELWSADVAFVTQCQYESIDKWLVGSPVLVVEVKSPGNTDADMRDKSMTALAGGAEECWVVDYEKCMITVYRQTSGIRLYHAAAGDSVAVAALSGSIQLDRLFENI